MAKPRLAASVRDRVAKFQVRQLLYSRDTAEDERVSRVNGYGGVNTYEVWIPTDGNSWKGGYFISDWPENALELSTNSRLKSSREQTTSHIEFYGTTCPRGKAAVSRKLRTSARAQAVRNLLLRCLYANEQTSIVRWLYPSKLSSMMRKGKYRRATTSLYLIESRDAERKLSEARKRKKALATKPAKIR
jgi:hypothetical protein